MPETPTDASVSPGGGPHVALADGERLTVGSPLGAVAEQPVSDQPVSEQQGGDQPVSDQPVSDQPEHLEGSADCAPRLVWWRELGMLVGLYALYSLIRNMAPDQVVEAQYNARVILDAERTIGWDVEHQMNLWAAELPSLIIPSNYYYATLHMTVTAGVLLWMYRRRAAQYARARSVLLVMTLFALVGYWVYPLAPPRLMTGGGFVDTVREFGLWGVTPSDDLVSLSNQYAAMPSMHVGWSLWAGVALAWLARRQWVRMLGVLYPICTLMVVVITANHFWLDAVAALVLFVIAAVVVDGCARAKARAAATIAERRADAEVASGRGAEAEVNPERDLVR